MVVGIVTCEVKPEPDPDEAPLVEALTARGVRAEIVAWDDASVAWRGLDACVLRSTWNYVHHLPSFLAWLERVETETRVLNPPPVVRWNLHESYLRELGARGIPTPPTELRLAERILAPLARDLLYARVDLARDASGAPLLMELELAEPSLFLVQSPRAMARFADAIARLGI